MAVHGYHPYAEDGEIYLPGIEKILNPHLFPVGREFFGSHASMTLFPNLVALFVRVTHLPFEFSLFLWYVAASFLLLAACWGLSGLLFSTARARWGAVCLIAALFTIPVAGTALYIMDQYLNPRNLAAFAGIFAVAQTIEKKYVRAILWLAFAASVHPLMWVFPFSFCLLFVVMKKVEEARPAWFGGARSVAAGLVMFAIPLAPKTGAAYHEAAKLHTYHYIQNWAWFEWLGVLAPVALLWWFSRIARAREWKNLERMCRALVVYDLIYFAGALAVDLPARFESLARMQPLRSLHLLYMLMFVVMGGLLGEFVLKNRAWRWMALFVPLSVGMLAAQRELFPASAHIEWPGERPKNPWAQAFVWIRENTPEDAVFAIDPLYSHLPGEDEIGFRCLAERSRLADIGKDSGVVSMFPLMADEWWGQVEDQSAWKSFQAEDFERLKQKYGVSWVVVQQPGVAGLECAYENSVVKVCRVR